MIWEAMASTSTACSAEKNWNAGCPDSATRCAYSCAAIIAGQRVPSHAVPRADIDAVRNRLREDASLCCMCASSLTSKNKALYTPWLSTSCLRLDTPPQLVSIYPPKRVRTSAIASYKINLRFRIEGMTQLFRYRIVEE